MPQYRYELYNPGQFPEHADALNKMAADGWRIHTALPNYTELYILWEKADDETANGNGRRGKQQAAPAAQPTPGAPGAQR